MLRMTRRSFIQTTAGAAAAGLLSGGWLDFAFANQTGYFESQFGITDAICGRALAKALSRGGDFADLYFEHSLLNWLALEDGKVDRAYASVVLGVGIRTVRGDQVGYGYTQELTEEAMLAAAATAATIADGPAGAPARVFTPARTGDYYPLPRLFTAIPISERLPVVQAVNDRCFALSPLIVKANVELHTSQSRLLLVGSDGRRVEDLRPKSYLSVAVVAEKNGRREQARWNLGGRRGFEYYTPAIVDEVASEAVMRAGFLFDATQPPAGETPVVLGPGVTGILLHESIGHGMEADFNRKKVSTFCTMIGKQVAEPFVTILDDGTIANQVGSLNFDDEGEASQRTVLVENGVLTSYLHDRISAKHYGVAPTGNGRREDYSFQPMPRMRNTFMLPGPEAPESLIRAAKNGIYVADVTNGQVKIGEGDFAFYVSRGQRIENGKLTAPIKDINIIGNGPKLLRNIIAVAGDLKMHQGGAGYCGKNGQKVPVSFGLPTVLVKSVTVGGVKAGSQA